MKNCLICGAVIAATFTYCQPCSKAHRMAQEHINRKAIRDANAKSLACACGCGLTFRPVNGTQKYAPTCKESRVGEKKHGKYIPREKQAKLPAPRRVVIPHKSAKEIAFDARLDKVVLECYSHGNSYERARIWALNPTLRNQFAEMTAANAMDATL